MNSPPFLLPILLLSVSALPFAPGQSSIPNTPQGFQLQFHPVFESFQRSNDQEIQSRLDSFSIPSHWFNDSFGPDHGPDLSARYSAEFAEFKARILADFAGISPLRTRLQVDPSASTDIRTRRWSAAEDTTAMQRPAGLQVTLPPVQKFAIDVFATPGQYGRLTSWVESFVYIDGAFRFFGRRNKPFWANKP